MATIKLLVVGITYLSRINWDKYITMARLYPDSEFRVVFPKQSYSSLGGKLVGESGEFGNLKFIPLPAYLSRYETGHFYGKAFKTLIEQFQPDVILDEHGAFANSLAQAIWHKKNVSPKTKVAYFTWWNLPYHLSPPRALIERYNFRNTVGAITGNADAKDILIARGYDKPIKVIPLLGADETLYVRKPQPDLQRKHLEAGEIGMLYAGRLVEEKGILTLLRALRRLNAMNLTTKWKMLIVGAGDFKPVAERFVKEHALEPVVMFLPPVSHYDVIKYMNISEIFVLPSETTPRWKEQFGHVLIEAMACENAVVGSSSAEIPNVIGEAGMIFQEKNDAELAAALARLIENPALRRELAQKGRKRFLEQFTHAQIAKKTYETCAELAELAAPKMMEAVK